MSKPYYTAFPESEDAFGCALHRKTPVLMLTMGKVASKSIGRSLEKCYDGAIVHCHGIKESGKCRPGQFGPEHFDARFRALWDWGAAGKPVKIISPVRESLDRNLSDFFHNFHQYVPTDFPVQTFSVDEVTRLFYANMPHLKHAYWFDNVLFPLTGIDVLNRWRPDFLRAEFGNNQWRTLVFRTELPDAEKEAAISEFLNTPVRLTNSNTAAEKGYASFYQHFRKHFRPKPGYLASLQETFYYQTFYGRQLSNVLW